MARSHGPSARPPNGAGPPHNRRPHFCLEVCMSVLAMAAALLVGHGVMAAHGRSLTIDDFEDKDRRAASGLSWISISDDLMGGGSIAELEVVDTGADPRHALRVTGEVAPSGFAGAWVALDGRARATDLSDFQGIRLRIRGNGVVQL